MIPLSYSRNIAIVSAFTLVLGYVVYCLANRWLRSKNSDVPYLIKPHGAHWLWGHEKSAWEAPDSTFHIRNVEESGSVFAMKGALFHPDILVVADPVALNHIFTKSSYDYIKSPVFRPFLLRLIGRSIVWAEGDQHKVQRQRLAPSFTHERVKLMNEKVRLATDAVVEKLRGHINSSDPVRIDAVAWCGRPTLDVVGSVGFGYDFQCGDDPAAKAFNAAWDKNIALGLTLPAFIAPVVLRAFPWLGDLPIKAMESQCEIKAIIRALGREIYANRQVGSKEETDLMSSLMALEEAGTADLDEVLDQITAFMLAGTVTTTTLVALALYELSRDTNLQSRLREEISQFHGTGPGGEATYNELQTKLPLLDAFCKETLRYWPPVPLPDRVATKDDVIKLKYPVKTKHGYTDTLRISKGQIVVVPTVAVNRSIRIWGEDANVFRVERWLEPGGVPEAATSGVFGTFTFLEGPRRCIAYRLAVFEIKVMILHFVKNFEFSPTGDRIETRCSSLTAMQPYVVGQEQSGVQLPLLVKVIDS